jgi:hypothetical protein
LRCFVWRWEGLAQVPHYRWEHVVTMLAALLLLASAAAVEAA